MLSNRKTHPRKNQRDLLRTEREMERMSKLDPDCNASQETRSLLGTMQDKRHQTTRRNKHMRQKPTPPKF